MARLRAAERILRLQNELSRSNAKLHRALTRINAELEATSEIQKRLLPLAIPRVEGYSFAAHYQPSTECSGDFYDVLPLPDGRIGIAIGDVSGHGTPSMVAMAVTHMLIHVEEETMGDPAAMLFNLNNKMSHHLPTDQYLTIFYAVLDPASGKLVYSSAGHNPPLLADFKHQRFEFLSGCEGFPVKLIGPDMEYTNCEIQLEPEQHLIMYTDGLIEARNPAGDLFNPEGLIDSVGRSTPQSSQMLLDWILADLKHFVQGRQLDDDLSLLVTSRF
jgi:serine phosphatase RsbU (regulator of sigma subunit)